MSEIRELSLQNFRNLTNVKLMPGKGINFILGNNGAGKTSLLEAVVLLVNGKSFRSSRIDSCFQKNSKESLLRLKFADENMQEHFLALHRSGSAIRKKMDMIHSPGIQQSSRLLPITLYHPETSQLISGTPDSRRKFLDWYLFHVKHNYIKLWQDYQKLLKNRNALLRSGTRLLDLRYWNELLSEVGEQVTEARMQAMIHIHKLLEHMVDEYFSSIFETRFIFQKGWVGDSLLDVLLSQQETDVEKKHTQSGSHRDDFSISVNALRGKDKVSRGQSKLLNFLLLLAVSKDIRNMENKKPVLLLDDLDSELDSENSEKIAGIIVDLGLQALITGTRKPTWQERINHLEMFHVEHGELKKML